MLRIDLSPTYDMEGNLLFAPSLDLALAAYDPPIFDIEDIVTSPLGTGLRHYYLPGTQTLVLTTYLNLDPMFDSAWAPSVFDNL